VKCRHECSRLRDADATLGRQLLRARLRKSLQAAVVGEELSREVERARVRRTVPKHECDQLAIGQGLSPTGQEPFPRPFVQRHSRHEYRHA